MVSCCYKCMHTNLYKLFRANVGDQISQVNKSAVNTSHYSLLIQKRNDLTMKFTITVVGICLSAIIRGIALFLFFKTVSVNIHNKMLRNILNASIIFFDCNFIGNIVNRFSKDLVTVDESIPFPIHHLTAVNIIKIQLIFHIITTKILDYFWDCWKSSDYSFHECYIINTSATTLDKLFSIKARLFEDRKTIKATGRFK